MLIGLFEPLDTEEQFQNKTRRILCAKFPASTLVLPKVLKVKTRTYKVAANLLSTPHMPNLGFYFSSSCITDVMSKTFPKSLVSNQYQSTI